MWNANSYFLGLTGKLKLTKGKYKFCRITGIGELEEVLADRNRKAEIALDDSDEGITMQAPGGGYFNRRSVVVFILQQFKLKDMDDREAKMDEIRRIYNRFLSKIIIDSYQVPEMKYLQRDRMPYHELPGMFAVGSCGLYFTLTFDEPVDLKYNEQDWEQ